MKKENQKFIFQVLAFTAMVAFALTDHNGWASIMLLMLLFVIK